MLTKHPEMDLRSALEADSKRTWTPLNLLVRYLVSPTVSASVLLRGSDALLARGNHWASRLLRARLANKHGVHIAEGAQIGNAFRLPHPVGVVIGPGVVIADWVSVYQGVTIGAAAPRSESWVFPTIENDVKVYANAVLLGSITVGEGATIGAGAIVTKSVSAGATIVGTNSVRLAGHPTSGIDPVTDQRAAPPLI